MAGDARWAQRRGLIPRVSIHARAWRATDSARTGYNFRSFNSRPRVAGDARKVSPMLWRNSFNSRPRVAGDLRDCCELARLDCFNSRPRVAGDGFGGLSAAPRWMFQFTPARGGRREALFSDQVRIFVSIHARAWRATQEPAISRGSASFQFTPARGGRLRPYSTVLLHACFNSRPRVAGDNGLSNARQKKERFNSRPRVAGDTLGTGLGFVNMVSIHARAWRATR